MVAGRLLRINNVDMATTRSSPTIPIRADALARVRAECAGRGIRLNHVASVGSIFYVTLMPELRGLLDRVYAHWQRDQFARLIWPQESPGGLILDAFDAYPDEASARARLHPRAAGLGPGRPVRG